MAAVAFRLYSARASDPLASVISIMLRFPHIAQQMPFFNDTRRRRNEPRLYGRPAAGEEEAPLGDLLRDVAEVLLTNAQVIRDAAEEFAQRVPPAASARRAEARPMAIPPPGRDRLTAAVSDYACASLELKSDDADGGGAPLLSADALGAFAAQPLANLPLSCDRFAVEVPKEVVGLADARPDLGFDVSAHPEAASAPARRVLARLAKDCEAFASQYNADGHPAAGAGPAHGRRV